MKILKVGEHFINVDAVARVVVTDLDEYGKLVVVTMLSTTIVARENGSLVRSEELRFREEEAEIIINYFENLANEITEKS
jgi:hypothetical protein